MADENKPLKFDRTDRATRLFLDGLDDLAKKIRALELEVVKYEGTLRHYVSYAALVGFLLASLLAVGTLMAWFGTQVKEATNAIRQENTEARRDQAAKLEEVGKDIEWMRKKVDGSSHFSPEEKPKKKGR